jgi:hypothetical protein
MCSTNVTCNIPHGENLQLVRKENNITCVKEIYNIVLELIQFFAIH